MSNRIRFYTIAYEDHFGNVFNEPVSKLLRQLNDMLDTNIDSVKKSLDEGRHIRIFSLTEDFGTELNQFIMPFGKLKANMSYIESNDHKTLQLLDQTIFDVNLMYYDGQHKIMALSQDISGPSVKMIELYLSKFLPSNEKIIKINPIYVNYTLEKIKKSERISKVVIKFDFSKSTNEFIRQRLTPSDSKKSFMRSIKDIASNSIDLNATTLDLTISAGRRNLDKESLIQYIESMHIDDEYIKSVDISYQSGKKESVNTAQLKNSSVVLSHTFSSEKNLTTDFLLDRLPNESDSTIQKVIKEKVRDFDSVVREYYRNAR